MSPKAEIICRLIQVTPLTCPQIIVQSGLTPKEVENTLHNHRSVIKMEGQGRKHTFQFIGEFDKPETGNIEIRPTTWWGAIVPAEPLERVWA